MIQEIEKRLPGQQPEELPSTYDLRNNYPNPFNPSTQIEYQLPEESNVRMDIIDASGRIVRTIRESSQSAGYYAFTWDATTNIGSQLQSGVYFCRLQAGSYTETIKMVYLR